MNGGSEQAGGFIRELTEAARANPVSAALIGMGAVWLFASRSRQGEELIRRSGIDRLPGAARDAWEGTSSNLRSHARHIGEATKETSDTLRRRGDQMVDRISETGERLARTAGEFADDLPDQAGALLDDVRGRMTELFRSQPLAIGAVGLAIGAAIAASFPATDTEAEYLGGPSDFVKDKARELAGEQVERATDVGQKVTEAVADEASQQGLTADALKTTATDLSEKVSRVADAAAGRVS